MAAMTPQKKADRLATVSFFHARGFRPGWT